MEIFFSNAIRKGRIVLGKSPIRTVGSEEVWLLLSILEDSMQHVKTITCKFLLTSRSLLKYRSNILQALAINLKYKKAYQNYTAFYLAQS